MKVQPTEQPTGTNPKKNHTNELLLALNVLLLFLLVFNLFHIRSEAPAETAPETTASVETAVETTAPAQTVPPETEPSEEDLARSIGEEGLTKLFTYSTLEEYNQIRDYLNSLPGSEGVADAQYPVLDETSFGTLNMHLNDTLIIRDGDQWFALCQVASRQSGENGTGQIGVYYRVADGQMRDVRIYPFGG